MTAYFSDVVVDFLRRQQFDAVVFNPGASFRGLHDSLVHLSGAPEVVMAAHEEIAVAIAHGYHKASNRHMAVCTHANVGLLHAGMAIFNAWCDRVPLLVIGGNGPVDAARRRPWVDWIHTAAHLSSVVDGYVKWSDQPVGQWSTLESLHRAVKLMNTPMRAPVFVGLDFDVQEQVAELDLSAFPATAGDPAELATLSAAAVADLAQRLCAAASPVLVVDHSGQDPRTLAAVVELAEAAGAAVLDRGNRLSFPATHPLNLTGVDPAALDPVDLVVAFEVADPHSALEPLPGNPFVVTIGHNELLTGSWAADYLRLAAVDQAHVADTLGTFEALTAAVTARAAGASEFLARRDRRVERLAHAHHAARAAWARQADQAKDGAGIDTIGALDEIHAAVKDHEWVLVNSGGVANDSWVRKLWPLDRPSSYLGLSGGAGLGYGPGASVGAALAHRQDGTLCVNIQADGDLLYTPSALWTMAAHPVPLLTVVVNNQRYANSTEHAAAVAAARGRDRGKAHVGTSFATNPVDFAGLARSYGVHAPPRATTTDEIAATVRKAAELVLETGKPALVELLVD